MLITQRHLSRRTILRGSERPLRAPLLDAMVPACGPIDSGRRAGAAAGFHCLSAGCG